MKFSWDLLSLSRGATCFSEFAWINLWRSCLRFKPNGLFFWDFLLLLPRKYKTIRHHLYTWQIVFILFIVLDYPCSSNTFFQSCVLILAKTFLRRAFLRILFNNCYHKMLTWFLIESSERTSWSLEATNAFNDLDLHLAFSDRSALFFDRA